MNVFGPGRRAGRALEEGRRTVAIKGKQALVVYEVEPVGRPQFTARRRLPLNGRDPRGVTEPAASHSTSVSPNFLDALQCERHSAGGRPENRPHCTGSKAALFSRPAARFIALSSALVQRLRQRLDH